MGNEAVTIAQKQPQSSVSTWIERDPASRCYSGQLQLYIAIAIAARTTL